MVISTRLIVTLGLAASIVAASELHPFLVPQNYCGVHLNNVLALVCQGNYYSKRKWEPSGDINAVQTDFEGNPYPFRIRSKTYSAPGETFERKSRGIIEECCMNPCTFAQLSAYCG